MYCLTLFTNLRDPRDYGRIVEGPFRFETYKAICEWKSEFERLLEQLNRELVLPPSCSGIEIEEYSRRLRPDAAIPPAPHKVINGLREFWAAYVLQAAGT